MLLAGVSGSSTADSAGVGTILIPAMKRERYPAQFAVAVTAAASVMGIIIPPSINMIVWGAITSTSIGGLFLGCILPEVLIGGIPMLKAFGTTLIYLAVMLFAILLCIVFPEVVLFIPRLLAPNFL